MSKQNLIISLLRQSRRNTRVAFLNNFISSLSCQFFCEQFHSTWKEIKTQDRCWAKPHLSVVTNCQFFQMIGAHLLNKVQLQWILHGRAIRKYLTSQLQPINFDHDDCVWKLSHSSVWESMSIFLLCLSLRSFFLILGFASCNIAEHGGE